MKANKLYFDLYSTCGDRMPYEEYKKYYQKHNIVYIVLVDEKIYTKVDRETMFKLKLNLGCFISHYPYDTPQEVEQNAMAIINEIKARYVEPNDFISIEKKREPARSLSALALAETMIANN